MTTFHVYESVNFTCVSRSHFFAVLKGRGKKETMPTLFRFKKKKLGAGGRGAGREGLQT